MKTVSMPDGLIPTPCAHGGFFIFDPETATSSFGMTEEEAIANLHADNEFHRNNPFDVEWVREKLAEGMASGVCEKEPERVLEEIMAKGRERRAAGQSIGEQAKPSALPRSS